MIVADSAPQLVAVTRTRGRLQYAEAIPAIAITAATIVSQSAAIGMNFDNSIELAPKVTVAAKYIRRMSSTREVFQGHAPDSPTGSPHPHAPSRRQGCEHERTGCSMADKLDPALGPNSETVRNDLQRRRELAAITKRELVSIIRTYEVGIAELRARIDTDWGD